MPLLPLKPFRATRAVFPLFLDVLYMSAYISDDDDYNR